MIKTSCIRCKFYKVKDEHTGYCRVQTNENVSKKALRPLVQSQSSCEKWIDCEQQYYIRLGWIKALINRKQESDQQ